MTNHPTILALDLGTQSGWAEYRGGVITSGTRALDLTQSRGGRYVNFDTMLEKHADVDYVYYEYVRRHIGTKAAHTYGGFQAVLMMFCDRYKLPCRPLEIGTIKKHWTGKGNAKKDQMITQAIHRGFNPKDDNEADALAVLDYAMVELGAKEPTQGNLL